MKVMLAVDGSTHAEEAAIFLAHLPHTDKLEITVLTVVNVPHINSTRPDSTWRPEVVARETEVAKQTYEKIAAMFEGADATVRHLTAEGHIGDAIVEEATKSKIDLIVMGAKGSSTIRRILLGSTSDYVATHAPCSVLIVRPTGIQAHKHERLRVALAYDQTGPSQAAIEEFSEFNWGPQTEMHVVSAVSYVSEFLNETIEDPNSMASEARAAVRQAAEQLRDVAPSVKGHLIECDHIGDGIVQFVEDNDCDLVVMGNTSRSTLGRLFLGSISCFVLRHSPSSVWITRNREIKGVNKSSGQQTADIG